MFGKLVICYFHIEWLESIRQEIPEYVDELLVINVMPDTVHDVLSL